MPSISTVFPPCIIVCCLAAVASGADSMFHSRASLRLSHAPVVASSTAEANASWNLAHNLAENAADQGQTSNIAGSSVQVSDGMMHGVSTTSRNTTSSVDMRFTAVETVFLNRRVDHFTPKLVLSGLVLGGVFGMMGSGGSMIAKPLLYFVFEQRPFKLTIFEMYCILVCLGTFGALRGIWASLVVWWHVILFGTFTSIVGTSVGAGLAQLISNETQMVVFVGVILYVSADMWPKDSPKDSPKTALRVADRDTPNESVDFRMVVCIAIFAGVLCGFLGVGGGFLLTPSLVKIGHDLKTAVPTSLTVIGINACIGLIWYSYLFDMTISKDVDYLVVGGMVIVACLGMLCSDCLASRISKSSRQKAYAVFLGCLAFLMVCCRLQQKGQTA